MISNTSLSNKYIQRENVELLKHIKIMKAAPACFRFTKKPSSGSHNQYLAKNTGLVQRIYRRCTDVVSVMFEAVMHLYILQGKQRT